MNESKHTEHEEHLDEQRDANRDPITGAPGAHPVGTGIGAAGGGAAGAAIGTAVGGPVGAGIGIVAGAIVGGLAGKGAAEAIDPTAEDAYWRENYRSRDYVDKNAPYETYRSAYRVGYEGYMRHRGRKYDEVEPELRSDYERGSGTGLKWNQARSASRDAWDRLDKSSNPPAERPAEGSATRPAGNQSGCGCS
jgi:uncharacterized protein YcfJ